MTFKSKESLVIANVTFALTPWSDACLTEQSMRLHLSLLVQLPRGLGRIVTRFAIIALGEATLLVNVKRKLDACFALTMGNVPRVLPAAFKSPLRLGPQESVVKYRKS